MENTHNTNTTDTIMENHWQHAENEENNVREPNDLDLRSAEANGFGTDEDQEEQSIYASSYDDPEDDDEDEDGDDDEDDSPDRNWGTVDPQEHPGIPSDMDPSGPGSAV